VSVAIEQREFSLEFVVNPVISGRPAAGYNVTSVVVDPPIVTLTGPLDVLQSIDAVEGVGTAEVVIGDARATVTRTVEIALPTGLGVIGSNTVLVTVAISPAPGEIAFLVVPQVRNVADGLVVTQAAPVFVTLSGDAPTLQALTPESIVVVADAQGLGEGLFTLPMTVSAPPGTSVVRVEPGELGIALTARP
jgi:YbbR domain-containing protein